MVKLKNSIFDSLATLVRKVFTPRENKFPARLKNVEWLTWSPTVNIVALYQSASLSKNVNTWNKDAYDNFNEWMNEWLNESMDEKRKEGRNERASWWVTEWGREVHHKTVLVRIISNFHAHLACSRLWSDGGKEENSRGRPNPPRSRPILPLLPRLFSSFPPFESLEQANANLTHFHYSH